MPYQPTLPTLLDEVKQISISKLKEFGYMEPGIINKSGNLKWSRGGRQVGDINISVNMTDEPHLRLSYLYNKTESIDYKVRLESVPSNIGRGKVWYFICPATGKRCKKLYGAGKYFLHREAYPDAMYESQTYSRYGRYLDKVIRTEHLREKLYSELHSKYFKTHYAGRPTKWYKRIQAKLEQAQRMESQYLQIIQSI